VQGALSAYHVHVPWTIPVNLLDTFIVSYPSKRYRSVWIGIVVLSAQSVVNIESGVAEKLRCSAIEAGPSDFARPSHPSK